MDRIGLDKVLHFVGCFVIAVVVMMGSYYFTADRSMSQCAGFGVAMLIGVCKEVSDIKTTGFGWKDLLADLCGTILAVVFGFFM